jgi:hypothetical protein
LKFHTLGTILAEEHSNFSRPWAKINPPGLGYSAFRSRNLRVAVRPP